MLFKRYILFFSLLVSSRLSFAQQAAPAQLDTTVSVFWEQNLKTRIQILDPNEYDPGKKNAVLTVYKESNTALKELFKDTLHVGFLKVKVTDQNGDGIRDLLIYHTSEDPQNITWHLYLVGQEPASLKKIKGFERIFNPMYDHSRCLIYGVESYDRRMIFREYYINKAGILGLARPR